MCGGTKPLEEFRKYPNGKSYPYCLECQTIETRRRYLVSKNVRTDEELEEEKAINELYEKRLEKGLKTFGGKSRTGSVKAIVDKQMKDLAN
jgi:hypothetical protein